MSTSLVANSDRLASGTAVIISESSLLVKQFPCIRGIAGTVTLSYSEPCSYTGSKVVMYSVKMPSGVFGGRSVRVSQYELEVVDDVRKGTL